MKRADVREDERGLDGHDDAERHEVGRNSGPRQPPGLIRFGFAQGDLRPAILSAVPVRCIVRSG